MALTLIIRSGTDSSEGERQSITFDHPRIVLGRSESCDLRIPDVSVSHRHASIRQRGTEYILVDEGSTNGTFIGSVRLHPQAPRVVRNAEMIRLGRIWLEVRVEYAAAKISTANDTKELALALVAKALQAQGEHTEPRIFVVEGPDQGMELQVPKAPQAVIIGRGREADLPIDVDDASRRHARISRQADGILLRDLGSRNGTWFNDEQVPADRDIALKHGDKFRIGPDVFEFEHRALNALRCLEQEPDEPISHDSAPSAPSPSPEPPPSTHPPSAHPSSTHPSSTHPPSAHPPSVHPPHPPKPAAKKPESPHWGKTDVLVVLVALAVLGLSIVGLLWLFRG